MLKPAREGIGAGILEIKYAVLKGFGYAVRHIHILRWAKVAVARKNTAFFLHAVFISVGHVPRF